MEVPLDVPKLAAQLRSRLHAESHRCHSAGAKGHNRVSNTIMRHWPPALNSYIVPSLSRSRNILMLVPHASLTGLLTCAWNIPQEVECSCCSSTSTWAQPATSCCQWWTDEDEMAVTLASRLTGHAFPSSCPNGRQLCRHSRKKCSG